MKYIISVILASSALIYVLIHFEILSPKYAQNTMNGQVIEIIDGDTFKLKVGAKVYNVEMIGIDAPEFGQNFGEYAGAYLAELVIKRDVVLHVHHEDSDGYLFGELFLNDISINKLQLLDGYAWAKRGFSEDRAWAGLEKLARDKGLGLWRNGDPTPPWKFRNSPVSL